MKKKKKGLLIVAIITLIIGVGLVFVGIKFLSKPSVIFTQSFDYLTKPLDNFKTESDLLKQIESNDKIKYQGIIDVKLNENLGLGVNNLNFKLELAENKTDKVSRYFLDSKLDNQSLLQVDSYLKDNKLYLTIDDIFDKYYYTNVDYISLFENSTNTEDIDILLKEVKNAIKEVMTDDKFNKEKLNAQVDDDFENLTRISLNVTDKLLSDIFSQVINNIKNNESSLNALVNIMQEDNETVIKMLNETLQDLEDVTGEVLFTYNIYYKNINAIRKVELISGDKIITYTGNDNTYKLKFDEVNSNLFTLVIKESKNDNYELSLKSEELNLQGNITKNNNIYHMNFDLKDGQGTSLGTLGINYIMENSTQDQIKISYNYEGQEFITLSVTSKFSFGEIVSLPNLSTSKDFNAITEDETMNIMNNLTNHPVVGPLFQLLGSNMM